MYIVMWSSILDRAGVYIFPLAQCMDFSLTYDCMLVCKITCTCMTCVFYNNMDMENVLEIALERERERGGGGVCELEGGGV